MRRYCRRTAAFTKSSMLWAFPRPPAWRSICPTTASIPKVFTEMWASFPAAKRLHDLIKADDPSPFPALTQIEVYGKEVTK